MAALACIVTFVESFLLGSVPWGLIVSKIAFGKDLRDEGSGNIGTTNAIRSMGMLGGGAVFVLDFGKGVFAGLLALAIANAFGLNASFARTLCALAFLGCVWGHIFTPWLKFKGGKGIAVAVGCLFVTFGPLGACLELAIFGVLVVATRYVSVGSIAAALACPLLALYFYFGNIPGWLLCTIGALTVVWAHRSNIQRLHTGCEARIGAAKQ